MAARELKSVVKADWSNAILVCAKCSKRLGGGFGKKGKHSLAKSLRKQLGIGRFRKAPIGIVEVKCLGVCPRGAVTMIDARTPDRWRIVPAGADLATLTREMGIER